jgi:hypothetical protein
MDIKVEITVDVVGTEFAKVCLLSVMLSVQTHLVPNDIWCSTYTPEASQG